MTESERRRVLDYGLNVIALERMKFMLSHICYPEIAVRGYNIEFEGIAFDPTDKSKFGRIHFKYYDGREKADRHADFAMERYYESCQAVEMDPRMRLRRGEEEADVDESWMEARLRRGRLEPEPYKYDSRKYCGSRKGKDGYDIAENGAYRNLARWDGSFVLTDWYHDIFPAGEGLYIVGMTRRRTQTTPTQYLRGIAHSSGIVLFPVIFTSVSRLKDRESGFYAEYNGSPYILRPDGGIYDYKCGHLPQTGGIDKTKFIEKIINWTLSGLQFYFRDTDAPVVVGSTYRPGEVIRAGFFIDVTTKLWRPAQRTRYLIASAHAARLFEVGDLCANNPKVAEWNLCVLDFNSYFKVMDVYERDGFTQVFLLHIPKAAAQLGSGEVSIVFNGGERGSLVELARQNFDEKLAMDVHPRSKDPVFVDRTYHPVGLDKEFRPMGLEPVIVPPDSPQAKLSVMVRRMSGETGTSGFLELDDHFTFPGVSGTVCEGCIYAGGIVGNGEGCGRLFTKTFRDNYIKGVCDFRKIRIDVPSKFEMRKVEEAAKALEEEEKRSDVFALRMLRKFTDKCLGGNIYRLREFDFRTICNDKEFGHHDPVRSVIIRSIMALAFGKAWPELNCYTIENGTFECGAINDPDRLVGGKLHGDKYFGLEKFNAPEILGRRCDNMMRLSGTIGNFMVLPSRGSFFRCLTSYKCYRYIDRFLAGLYSAMTGTGERNVEISAALYENRKLMAGYEGEAGFRKFIDRMMLNDYVDYDYRPRELFSYVWFLKRGLGAQEYVSAVNRYCRVCEEFIPRRSDLIIERLVRKLEDFK